MIKLKLDSLSEADKRDPSKVWVEVAEAIIDHIKNNAMVDSIPLTGISVSPPSFVTTQGQTVPTEGKIK